MKRIDILFLYQAIMASTDFLPVVDFLAVAVNRTFRMVEKADILLGQNLRS